MECETQEDLAAHESQTFSTGSIETLPTETTEEQDEEWRKELKVLLARKVPIGFRS